VLEDAVVLENERTAYGTYRLADGQWVHYATLLTESEMVRYRQSPQTFFDVVKEGEGNGKAKTIVGLVRARFNAMWLVHWELSCINPSVEQTFNLVFENTHPAIAPDGSFKEVPIGVDPTEWPLAIDLAKTVKAAQESPLYPGGPFTVYGDFCWSGDKSRAEAYFIPAGTRPNPQQTSSRDPEVAKKAMQQLQAEHMLGTAVAAGDEYVTFTVPDDEKVLEGTGDNTVARLVVYDNRAHRASAVDERTVLSLKATKKPLSLPLIGGIAGLLIVIVLLFMVLLRGGGGARGRGGPPAPPAPPQGYGPPPGGYGGTPGPGGYRAREATDDGTGPPAALFSSPAQPPAGTAVGAPHSLNTGSVSRPAPEPIVRVSCPACGTVTMATPGQPSVCFSCGQPIPGELTKGGGDASVPRFRAGDGERRQPAAGGRHDGPRRGDVARCIGPVLDPRRLGGARRKGPGPVLDLPQRAARQRGARDAEARRGSAPRA